MSSSIDHSKTVAGVRIEYETVFNYEADKVKCAISDTPFKEMLYPLKAMPCGHVFEQAQIERILETNSSRECPLDGRIIRCFHRLLTEHQAFFSTDMFIGVPYPPHLLPKM